MALSIRVLSDLDQLASQQMAWQRLADCMATPLLAHDWMLSCAEAFCEPGSLHVVQVFRDRELVAAAPLARVGAGTATRLELLGASSLFEPSGFLYDSDESLGALCDAVVRCGAALWLHRLPASGPTVPALKAAAKETGRLMIRDGGGCPGIAKYPSWSDYLASRTTRRRYDLRRARRQLEAIGRSEVIYLVPDADEVDGLLCKAFAIESAGWKGRNETAILSRHRLRRFLTALAHRTQKSGQLRLCFLKVGDDLVAMEIALVAYHAFWVLKVGYDERWAHGSPGLLLMTECIRATMERGVSRHELLGTAEPWIMPWADYVKPHINLHFYPYGWRGTSRWLLDNGRRVSGRLGRLAKSSLSG